MKKSLIAVIVLLAVFPKLHAQTQINKLTFSIKGGYNHTVINGYETTGVKTGFTGSTIYGGFVIEKGIAESKFINAGLLFSWVNDWHFLEIPFHYRQKLNKEFSIFAGPKLDLAADKFDKTKESTSKFLGISAEIGGQFNFSVHVFAETEYSIGISRSFNDEFFDINSGRRDNFRIGVGYYF
jgi:hypothetical protein